jgi:cob(I)alamin adenosyltransferase
MNGYVQVYTGNGKGKTTAALGLALRAAGAGLRVFIAQFVKGRPYSEHISLAKLKKEITVRIYGRPRFIHGNLVPADTTAARRGLKEAEAALKSGKYDLVILDEANVATSLKLFPVSELVRLADEKPPGVELVITGRYADPKLLKRADLVTRMSEIKHYFKMGIEARKGIEK